MFTNFFNVAGKKKKKAVKTNGFVQIENGSFFSDLDYAYLASPTATMALLKFHEFCVPPGLLQKFQKLWKKIENDYIRYGFYVIRIEYNVDGEIIAHHYCDPRDYLPKDKDDNGNVSTYLNTRSKVIFPAFNSNKTIVMSQIGKNGFESFVGQIYMYNDSSLPYRITPFYSVINWMQAEADSSMYVSKACDNAMFGNNIFMFKKSSDPTEKEIQIIDNLKATLSSVKGVDEAGQNILLEYNGDLEDVTKLISKVSISNEINVDLLNTADDKASEKICMACYGLPPILVKQNEGVFGNSGEAITVATNFYQATCLKEAANILDGLKEIGLIITSEIVDNGTNNPDNTGA